MAVKGIQDAVSCQPDNNNPWTEFETDDSRDQETGHDHRLQEHRMNRFAHRTE
jgi:hypothetical protein